CIQRLSGQVGIDTGATAGSYLGLFFLAAVFTAIGTWCSSWTTNPVVAFIVAAFACFILYSGFGAISTLPVFAAGLDYYIGMLGIDFHYRSISRGVVDTRDVIFFASFIALFLYLTNRFLVQRVQPDKGKWKAGGLIVFLVGLNIVAAMVHFRIDLT